MEDDTINNLIALLEECVVNGESGSDQLYAWFLGEADRIGEAIELAKLEVS